MAAARARARADRGDTKPKVRSDAYVGLLGISLLALSAAMLFAFLNWNAYPEGKPKPVQVAPKGAPAPVGGPPVNPPAGGVPPAMPPGGNPPAAPPDGKQVPPPGAPPAKK